MTRIVVDPARQIGTVDRNVFGGFVEHLGRCIYGGLFDEGSPLATTGGSAPTCSTCSVTSGWGCCAGPAATSSRTTTGPTGSGRRTSRPGPARAGLGRGGEQPVRHRRVHGLLRGARGRAVHLPEHGHRRPWMRHWPGSSTATRRRPDRLGAAAARERARRSRTGSATGAWATRCTATGRSARCPPRSTSPWPPAGPGPSRCWTRRPSWSAAGMNGWNDWDRVVIDGLAALVDLHSLHIYTGSRRLLDQRAPARTRRSAPSGAPAALIERAAYVKRHRQPAADRLRRVERVVPHR